MKHFNFWALALTAICMAACTSEDDLTQSPPAQQDEEVQIPIMFSSNKGNTTRANIEGVAAADSLGRQFVVSGYKGKKSKWAAENENKIVFDNYLVEYAENTAFTTESNVANWEYVGKGLIPHAVAHQITRQSIKYWDYTAAQYDFIAWSTGKKKAVYAEADLTDGKVFVSAITPETATTTDELAYTFTGKAKDLQECYISDMVTVKKAEYGRKENNEPVKLTFRQLGTKVRIGIYETIPGYSVRNVQFYVKDGELDASTPATATTPGIVADGQIVDKATIFTTTANKIFTEGTYTVYFPTVDDPTSEDNNQAHIKFTGSGDQSTVVDKWGTLNYTIAEDGERTAGAVYLGRSSNTASFAGSPEYDYYAFYLPNEEGTNLNLRVNFVLESIDGSGEVIEVKNAKAQIPLIYTQWKSGFAYTYLFKISDKTNGRTGVYDPTQADGATINSDPAGLYPITFDAVVVNSEDDMTQETITTVTTPSITTYQQNSTVVNADEYTVNGKDIFVTVNEDNDLVTFTDDIFTTGNAWLFLIDPGKTEAEVIDALQIQDDDAAPGTVKGRSGLVLTKADKVAADATLAANQFKLTNSVEFGADGNAISVGNKQALRFTPSAGQTYAFVYTKTASDDANNTDIYKEKTFAVDALVKGYYRLGYTLANTPSHSITDDKGTPETDDDITTNYYDAKKGVKYFSKTGDVYKMETAFIGQGVSNFYLDAAGTTIATGYAVSGTDYYYTTDHGMTYKKAKNIAYADFKTTTLYKDAACTTAKTETAPVDGQAYYYIEGTTIEYCIILPQQVNTWYVLNSDKVACGATETAIDGQTYFDMFTKNDGEYYAKIIKVE